MPTLDFKGKQFVYAHHLTVPFRQLDINAKKSLPTKSGNPNLDDNLIIHGDNLHALKALLPQYAGKIKCIYIDPPYNTGEEGWCYSDTVNSPLMQDWLKKSANPVEKEDMERHDKWLCMMWPRLQLLKALLAEGGKIFISIDDNEVFNLREIMDEIFGEYNFISTFVWRRRSGAMDSTNNVSKDHEYVLCYGNMGAENNLEGEKRTFARYTNPDNDPRGEWISDNLSAGKPGGDTLYAIKDPDTGFEYWPPKGRYWPYNPQTMLKKVQEGRILFPGTKTGAPMLKRFKKEAKSFVQPLSTWINSSSEKNIVYEGVVSIETGLNSEGTKLTKAIFGDKQFNYPKPLSLIKALISQATEADDIILDSFAGTATTAHAVMSLNKEDGGNRKFILVECEDYADTVTAERVRRVIKGVPAAKNEGLKAGLGGTFTFCELGNEISIENLLKGEKLPSYDELARYAFYTATSMTLDKVKQNADYLVGETSNYRVHMVYQADLAFLRSSQSALNMELAQSIAKSRKDTGKTALVFATHKFMGQKELTEMGITFCQLPYQLHRVIGE